ncbi:RNA polymerase sigma factor [Membranihabitans maritimus]|uniref:RNA polymerase sigma factor n=1 Tax=Membranihabitans maritimus TaxID=2904244 RepID=UPI001F007E10|nr:sigma-70 family RNA polymerase sigma factor [Membranihabitans maritimus]
MKRETLDHLVHEHRKGLYKFILSNVKNTEVAEDMTQDVLLRVTQAVQRSNEIENFRAYLFRTAKNHVINYWKKASKSQSLKEQYWNDIRQIKALRTNPCIDLDREIIFKQLESQLTDQQRKIFFLNRKEGLSYKEISEQLDISKSTVKNHMLLALKVIRSYMDKNYDKLIILLYIVLINL